MKTKDKKPICILELSDVKAKRFFLKGESYCNIDLPKYFNFDNLISIVMTSLGSKKLEDCYKEANRFPSNFDNVCYTILTNKDGKYAWRPLQLIHPFIYCSLVNSITKKNNWLTIKNKFKEFQSNDRIECYSIPKESHSKKSDKAETIIDWWVKIEQQSIKLSLEYNYVFITDITDCYSSLYTHSIAWALHTKEIAKEKIGKKDLIGNIIDKHIQGMRYGQTNGIPQGSVLLDFIAEMVLGYIDLELTEKIKLENIDDYRIIRYRDDYRIFGNNPYDIEKIAKLLTEALSNVGLKLNTSKTKLSDNIILSSLKSDKLYYFSNAPIYLRNKNNLFSTIQQELIYIHSIAREFQNSGIISKLLTKTYENRIKDATKIDEDVEVLISIITDIAFKNPRVYSVSTAIISKFMTLIDDSTIKDNLIEKIRLKFEQLPNTGIIYIWLQRLLYPLKKNICFPETLCKVVDKIDVNLWESAWLKEEYKEILKTNLIIDMKSLESSTSIFDLSEITPFKYDG